MPLEIKGVDLTAGKQGNPNCSPTLNVKGWEGGSGKSGWGRAYFTICFNRTLGSSQLMGSGGKNICSIFPENPQALFGIGAKALLPLRAPWSSPGAEGQEGGASSPQLGLDKPFSLKMQLQESELGVGPGACQACRVFLAAAP